jgi:lambda family phage portal protein
MTGIVRRTLGRWLSRALGEASTRWPSWAVRPAPARQLLAERWRDATRASFLAGTPLGATIVNAFVTSLVADGPSVRSQHPNRAMARALQSAWGRFFRKADAEHLGDLAALLGRVVASLVTAGEAFILMTTTERGELRLRLLSAEQVDPSVNRPTPDGGQIIAGIEISASGERVAYWVRETAPDSPGVQTLMMMPVRIAASEILHAFEPRVPGAVRGASWLAPVAQTIIELHKLLDALGARMNTAALFAGYVSDASGGVGGFDDATKTGDKAELSMEPGVVRLLPPGTEISWPTLPTTEGSDPLVRQMLRLIATGVGLPAFMVDGDYGQINYSAGKLALEGYKRRVAALRASVLGAQLLEPIWQRFVTLEILSRRIYAADFVSAAESYFDMSAMWPQFAPLDPYREAQSDVLLLRAGLKSRREIVEQRGRDIAEVDEEIQSDAIAPDLTAISFSQGDANAAA